MCPSLHLPSARLLYFADSDMQDSKLSHHAASEATKNQCLLQQVLEHFRGTQKLLVFFQSRQSIPICIDLNGIWRVAYAPELMAKPKFPGLLHLETIRHAGLASGQLWFPKQVTASDDSGILGNIDCMASGCRQTRTASFGQRSSPACVSLGGLRLLCARGRNQRTCCGASTLINSKGLVTLRFELLQLRERMYEIASPEIACAYSLKPPLH